MKYRINPVKASVITSNESCGIHELNTKCYGVCAAYGGTSSAWNIPPKCEEECDKFVEQLRHDYYGSGYCDHHAPNRPVLWNQSSRFFPYLLEKGNSPSSALTKCKAMCNRIPFHSEQCQDNCDLDRAALESFSFPSPSPNKKEKKKKKFPWLIVVLVGIVLILVSLVAYSNFN